MVDNYMVTEVLNEGVALRGREAEQRRIYENKMANVREAFINTQSLQSQLDSQKFKINMLSRLGQQIPQSMQDKLTSIANALAAQAKTLEQARTEMEAARQNWEAVRSNADAIEVRVDDLVLPWTEGDAKKNMCDGCGEIGVEHGECVMGCGGWECSDRCDCWICEECGEKLGPDPRDGDLMASCCYKAVGKALCESCHDNEVAVNGVSASENSTNKVCRHSPEGRAIRELSGEEVEENPKIVWPPAAELWSDRAKERMIDKYDARVEQIERYRWNRTAPRDASSYMRGMYIDRSADERFDQLGIRQAGIVSSSNGWFLMPDQDTFVRGWGAAREAATEYAIRMLDAGYHPVSGEPVDELTGEPMTDDDVPF